VKLGAFVCGGASQAKVRAVSTSGGKAENGAVQRWNSDDLLVRVLRSEVSAGELNDVPDTDSPPGSLNPHSNSPFAPTFDSPSLVSISADRELYESLSVVRSEKIATTDLLGFAARNRSTWALDVLANRFTQGLHDWSSLSAIARRFWEMPRDSDPTLDRVALQDLWAVSEALHERGIDDATERGLLLFIATRIANGRKFEHKNLEPLIENLLLAGMGDSARTLLPKLTDDTWKRHAIKIDVENPRFGGSLDAILLTLNEAYYRFGLERVVLDESSGTPFQRLSAETSHPAQPGPLVTVIMTCWSPGPEILTAVRSMIGQTYQNWELIVTDDASPDEYGHILQQVATLDPRIRVIRNSTNAGTYIRRNEAIALAQGEFVTMQDSDDWSHPRRIEIQVRDLLAAPERLANVVLAARVTEDLCFVTRRGGRLRVCEPSLLFRRAAVIDAVGYFDSTRKGADTEFRDRLETVSGTPVHVVGPEVPLKLMLTYDGSLSGEDFGGRSRWISPARRAYKYSYVRFHERVRAGAQSGKLQFPQVKRVIAAPPYMLEREPSSRRVDVLLVVDARPTESRTEFLEAVVAESLLAVQAGLSVALLQSDSATGATDLVPPPDMLQMLIDSGHLIPVFDGDVVEASVAVIRHAGAAQGHPAQRKSITVGRAVVIEDPSGGDVRGVTIAKPDVVATVTAWFGVEPTWIAKQPAPPRPKLISVMGDGETVSVAIDAPEVERLASVRFGGCEQFEDLAINFNEAGIVVGTAEVSSLPRGQSWLTVVGDAEGGQVSLQACWPDPTTSVLTKPGKRMVLLSETGALRVAAGEPALDGVGGDEFVRRYLSAAVSYATVFDGLIALKVEHGSDADLVAVQALRDVDGRVVRTREFTLGEAVGDTRLAMRPLGNFTDVRWKIYGTFRTPLGIVSVPIVVDDTTRVEDDSNFHIRKLSDGDFGILHVVPKTEDPPRDGFSERANFIFGISLASKQVVNDWAHTQLMLQRTLRSVLNQTDPRFRVIICGHERPKLAELDDRRVTFIVSDAKRPENSSQFRGDKMWKRRLIGAKLRRMGGGYFFPLDADDLVHKNVVEHVLADDNRRGYSIAQGYVEDFLHQRLAPVPGAWSAPFHHVCGSSAVLYFEPEDLPVGGRTEDGLYFNLFTSHAYWPIVAEESGKPLDTVPFPGGVYVVNHSQNLSFGLQRAGERVRNIAASVERHALEDGQAVLESQFMQKKQQ
jgi:glycosyltransferase involved in cell wall biosynthesis